MIFAKACESWTIFISKTSHKEGFSSAQKMALKTRPEGYFSDGICDVFCARFNFYTKK